MYSCTPVPFTHVLLYSCTPKFLYCCTPVLLYSCGPVFLNSCTPVLLYSHTPILPYSCTPILLYSCTSLLLFSCTTDVKPVFLRGLPPVLPHIEDLGVDACPVEVPGGAGQADIGGLVEERPWNLQVPLHITWGPRYQFGPIKPS